METLIDRYYSAGHKYNAISFYVTFFIQSITKCFTVSINCKLKEREREFKGKISLTLARRKEFFQDNTNKSARFLLPRFSVENS